MNPTGARAARAGQFFSNGARSLLLVGAGLLIGLAGLLFATLASDRAREEARLREELSGQARLVEAAVSERVRKIDYALLVVRGAVRTGGRTALPDAYAVLKEAGLLGIVTSLLVFDTDGKVVLVDGKAPGKPISVTDRDYFAALRDGEDVLAISKPIVGRASGRPAIAFARRISDARGFAGGVVVGVTPEALLEVASPARRDGSDITTLMSVDGVVLARTRDLATYLGKRIDAEALATLQAAATGYAVRASPTDGVLRAHALRRVAGLPLYIAVGDTLDGIDAELAPRRRALIAGAAVAALLIVVLFSYSAFHVRRRAEELRALAALTTRLELAQEVSGVGSWVWHIAADRADDRVEISEQICRLLGIAEGAIDVRFASFVALVPDEEHAALHAAFRTLLKDGAVEYEHHARHADGSLHLFVERARVIERDAAGLARIVIGTLRDVTESRQMRAELAARERRLDAIVSSLAEGLVVRDRSGRISFANDAVARLTGVAKETLIGSRVQDVAWQVVDEQGRVLPPEQHPALRTLAEGQPIEHGLYGMRSADGHVAWVSVNTRLLAPAGGTDDGADAVVASFADVSRLRDADREGRLAAAIFAQVSQPIMVTDAEARILRVNRAFTDTFGYTVEEAIGANPSLLRSRRHDAAFYRALWQQLECEGAWRGEIWNRRKDGTVIPLLASITRISEPFSAETRYIAAYADLATQKEAEEALRRAANHDALTGLPNRVLFRDRLQTALVQAKRKGTRVALAFIDLDGFKPVNDVHGHLAGDFLLQVVADRMRGSLRAGDTVARLGGDEFAAILVEVGESAGVRRALNGLLAVIREPVAWEGVQLQVGASIGVALAPDDGEAVDALLDVADTAMYAAKEAGRGRIVFSGERGAEEKAPGEKAPGEKTPGEKTPEEKA